MANPRKNTEGYDDPTAYHALKKVMREESDPDRRLNALVAVLKYVINGAGFDLLNRIELRDRKSGRIFR